MIQATLHSLNSKTRTQYWFFFSFDTQKSSKPASQTWARNWGLLPNPTISRSQETLAHRQESTVREFEPQTTWEQVKVLTIPTNPSLVLYWFCQSLLHVILMFCIWSLFVKPKLCIATDNTRNMIYFLTYSWSSTQSNMLPHA